MSTADGEARRDELARLATDLIARGGLEAVTIRDLADAIGTSTKVVTRTFPNKRELLLHVYEAAAARARARVTAARAASGDDVLACAEALLPLDDERRAGWAVWLAFWGTALADDAFRAEQRARVRGTRELLASVAQAAVAAGTLPPATDPDRLATDLLTAVTGVAVQALFDPRDWPPERQREVLATQVRGEATRVATDG